MLIPRKTKYRKNHLRRSKGVVVNASLKRGIVGLQATQVGILTAKHLDTIRRTLVRYLKRQAKVWIRLFADCGVTARAKESRMGSGKGNVSYWICYIRPNTILFEITKAPKELLYKALFAVQERLPIKTKFIFK